MACNGRCVLRGGRRAHCRSRSRCSCRCADSGNLAGVDLVSHRVFRVFNSTDCSKASGFNPPVILATAFLLVLRASRGFGTFGLRFHPQSSRGIARVPKRVSGDQTRGSALAEAADAHPGIILRPQKQTYTKLITPAPISFKPRPFSTDRADPLIIPFDGVYWIFKAPDVRLPANSREARGSPEMFSIRSNDRQPLTMEAHQNLGTRVSMDCCSRIQIAIENADRYPQSVSLELVLIDTTAPSKPYLSLGRAAVNSTRPWTLYGNRLTTSETLNFGIPPHSPMRRFDEVMIIFRLNAERADAEAKIGIDHFMFVPRGL